MVIVNSYFKTKQIHVYNKRDMIPKTISRDTFEIRKMHRSWHGLIFGSIMCIWNKWPLSTNSCVISTAIDHKWCLVTFQSYANISLAKNIVCYGAYLDVRASKIRTSANGFGAWASGCYAPKTYRFDLFFLSVLVFFLFYFIIKFLYVIMNWFINYFDKVYS